MEKEKNAIVEYSKDFATSMNDYSAYEMDLILALAYSARKKVVDHMNVSIDKDLEIELSSQAIKKILQGNTSMKRLTETLEKVFDTKIYFEEDGYNVSEHIFKRLCFSSDSKKIIFVLRKKYIHLFFNLTGNFTRHEMLEFASLKGKYAKKIYQIVMSYKTLKKKEYSGDFFRRLLNVPESYRWADVEAKVIGVAKKEFEKTNITNLELEKLRIGKGVDKVILRWDIKEPEIIKEEPKRKEIKKVPVEVEEVKFVEVEHLSKEDEERAVSQLESQGIDRAFLGEMKRRSETMYYNMLKNCLEGSK